MLRGTGWQLKQPGRAPAGRHYLPYTKHTRTHSLHAGPICRVSLARMHQACHPSPELGREGEGGRERGADTRMHTFAAVLCGMMMHLAVKLPSQQD